MIKYTDFHSFVNITVKNDEKMTYFHAFGMILMLMLIP